MRAREAALPGNTEGGRLPQGPLSCAWQNPQRTDRRRPRAPAARTTVPARELERRRPQPHWSSGPNHTDDHPPEQLARCHPVRRDKADSGTSGMSISAAGQPEHSQAVPGTAQPRAEGRSLRASPSLRRGLLARRQGRVCRNERTGRCSWKALRRSWGRET